MNGPLGCVRIQIWTVLPVWVRRKHSSVLFPLLRETFMSSVLCNHLFKWESETMTAQRSEKSSHSRYPKHPHLPPKLMSCGHFFTLIWSTKHFQLIVRGVKGCPGFSLQYMFPVVMTNRTFILLFAYYASMSQPGDLHYSFWADPPTLLPPYACAGAPATPRLMSCDKLLWPWQVLDSPPEPGHTRDIPGPDSVKHHFIGQIYLIMRGHKLEGKCTLQCLQPQGEALSIVQAVLCLCLLNKVPFEMIH